jgi:hypothetical protein
MKKLLLLLLFYSPFTLAAEKWFEMPNEAGGKILLLDSKCENSENGKLVIATSPKGNNLHGCWYYFSEMVHIVWKNGTTTSYNGNDFTFREKK